MIIERSEYDNNRSAFDISDKCNGCQKRGRRMQLNTLTNSGLAHLPKYVSQPLHALAHRTSMVHEPVDGFGCFVRVDVESGMVHVREE